MTSYISSHNARARLLWHIKNSPSTNAFSDGHTSQTLTFGELGAKARSVAAGLLEFSAKGDRVLCWIDTDLRLPIALIAHYMAGLVHVPINTRYGKIEVSYIVENSGANVAVVDTIERATMLQELGVEHIFMLHEPPGDSNTFRTFDELLAYEPLETLTPCKNDDAALFIYTSGTTGRSKAVVHTYQSIVKSINALVDLWRWNRNDVLILALPLFHVHGLCIGIHGTLLKGSRAILQRRFQPDLITLAVTQGGSIFMGVPTMYARLIKHLEEYPVEESHKLHKARLYTSGSAALSASMSDRFHKLTGHRILERYGMSETMITVSNPYHPSKRRAGTIGFAVPGYKVQVVDESFAPCKPGMVGQLVVKGGGMMKEYWRDPEKTKESFHKGWFLTGDAATINSEGYIVHSGRQSVDILKRGGYKISAREIEEALSQHPLIEEAAVYGVPDEEWGQRIAAALVVNDVVGTLDWVKECGDFLKGNLASDKHPDMIRLVDELPRNALGKIQKHELLSQHP